MERCEKLEMCPFFYDQLPNMPAVASLLKETYCKRDKRSCARYQVSSAGVAVPSDLLPNDSERAADLLRQNGNG